MKSGNHFCELGGDGSVLYLLVGPASDETKVRSTEVNAKVVIDRSADGDVVGIEILFPVGTLKDSAKIPA